MALAGLAAASSASAAEPEFGFSQFESATCARLTPECEPFTQAAEHPDLGVTVFRLNVINPGASKKEIPAGFIKNLRVDTPAGLSTNPEAVPYCKESDFAAKEVGAPFPAGVFTASTCSPETIIGENIVTVINEAHEDVELKGIVYNLEQPQGVPAEFGVAVNLKNLIGVEYYSHTIIEGGVSWRKEVGLDGKPIEPSGDSHEFFKIHEISAAPPLLESLLIYNGRAGEGFLTLPSDCAGKQTSYVEGESYEGSFAKTAFEPPVGVNGCDKVPFEPKVSVTPSTTQPDAPAGTTITVEVPQSKGNEAINSSALKEAKVTLPEGMTLNPAAASGLEACTDAQFARGVGSSKCPAGSEIGTVAIETPTLPAHSLQGKVYVGAPLNNSPKSGTDYRMFIDAESARYGVAVQLEGRIEANETTGQLTTLVAENPQIPFSSFTLTLSNGNHTPLANPLTCGEAASAALLTPYSTTTAVTPLIKPFDVACTSTPFKLEQSTSALPTTGGSTTAFTLGVTRPDGNQYLKKVSAELPLGMVAKIPSAQQCGEPAAKNGACSAASEIGSVTTSLGSGPAPYVLKGTVYLTGPYNGAPFGLSIVVPAEKVGPYNYGKIVTQAGISIDPYTARVMVAGEVPTIVGGVPLRMKALTIAINHGNFMLNPTNCGVLSTNTTLTSTTGGTDTISTPFQATGCSSLAFKPKFSYSTNAYTTKRFGASLNVKLAETAGNANIKSVEVTLPKKLPSRTSTLKLACLEKTFAANPSSCPAGSKVGTAKITTPTLPGTLEGPAYFVSHGGAAFPDLDLVVKGDGVTVILVGNTDISKNITHTKFLSLPDVPVNSFELNLPTGEKSALGSAGDFCKGKMYMPTAVVGQNGKTINEKIQIHVAECPVKVVGHKVAGSKATITAAVSSAGRLSTSGKDLVVVHKKIAKAVGNAKIEVRLSKLGKQILATKHQLDVKVRVGFKSSTGAKRESKAFVKLVFRS